MTEKGPLVCNLMLEGILDEDAKDNMPGVGGYRPSSW